MWFISWWFFWCLMWLVFRFMIILIVLIRRFVGISVRNRVSILLVCVVSV